jgi:HD domain-containing protein
VEIPQQGDDHDVWKTDATACLPLLRRAVDCGDGRKRSQRSVKPNLHWRNSLDWGTDGDEELMPFLGEMQVILTRFHREKVAVSDLVVPTRVSAFAGALSGCALGLAVAPHRARLQARRTPLGYRTFVRDRDRRGAADRENQLQRGNFGRGPADAVRGRDLWPAASNGGGCDRSTSGHASTIRALDDLDVHARFGRRHCGIGGYTNGRARLGRETLDSRGRRGTDRGSCGAALGAITVALRRTGSLSGYIRSVRPVVLATVPLYAPVIVILAYAYQEVAEWSILLFFPPAFAAQQLHRLYRQEREVSEALKRANDRLERANLSFATALVATLDARDRYTAGHSATVAIYARDIAHRLGLTPQEQQIAYVCGLVHDVGKIGLPPGLLDKPSSLTLDERRQMQLHPGIGETILAKVDDYGDIARIVRHHHERIDGEGYPDRLCGDDIPLISRIIAVADAYNAMTSDRPYRDAMPSRVARMRLAQAVESQFDTGVVAAFEAILTAETEDYRTGTFGEPSLAHSARGGALLDVPALVGIAAYAS